ncbi:MAG: glutaredoxin family protein [Armatimonadota bacterium]|nr:glutaredoxin family protein [Armatimonadota bacterium]
MPPLHVRLYTHPDCSVCDDVFHLLEDLRSDFEFLLEEVNIDEDPALKERLRCQIPVVTINGGNRVALRVTKDRLRRAFQRALQDQNSTQDQSAQDQSE